MVLLRNGDTLNVFKLQAKPVYLKVLRYDKHGNLKVRLLLKEDIQDIRLNANPLTPEQQKAFALKLSSIDTSLRHETPAEASHRIAIERAGFIAIRLSMGIGLRDNTLDKSLITNTNETTPRNPRQAAGMVLDAGILTNKGNFGYGLAYNAILTNGASGEGTFGRSATHYIGPEIAFSGRGVNGGVAVRGGIGAVYYTESFRGGYVTAVETSDLVFGVHLGLDLYANITKNLAFQATASGHFGSAKASYGSQNTDISLKRFSLTTGLVFLINN